MPPLEPFKLILAAGIEPATKIAHSPPPQAAGQPERFLCRVGCGTLRMSDPSHAHPRPRTGPLLPLQPQRGHPTAVVEGLVGRIVLYIWLPGTSHHGRVRVYIVLLLRHIALKRIDELLAGLQVLGAPL